MRRQTMSTTIADYAVLLDSQIQLSAQPSSGKPRSKFCRFNLASDFASDVKAVLFFRATVPGKDSRLRVFVNPAPTENTSDGFPIDEDYATNMSKGYFGLHMETIAGSKFKKGQENTVVFTISGDGTKFGDVILGDVVLHVQRQI
jgi:hypothetical protein